MAQPLPAILPEGVRSVILHCRPRMTFHLGHLRMLNVLYGLLQQGIAVTVLVIPYVEHEPENRTYIERLRHDYSITRDFYTAYLGRTRPTLTVTSYEELSITPEDISRYRRSYRELYGRGEPSVRHLIDEHQRPWSSPGIDFVPKCLAAIAHLKPDAMVAGRKHEFISDCFERVLNEAGVTVSAYVFDDLLDLRMTTGMDRTDSVHTYIEVNDQEDFVLYKLDALRGEPALLSDWLAHFAATLLASCPERARAGISNTHRTDAERIIALSRLLQNVRRMVPYSYQPRPGEFRVHWSDELFRSLGAADKSRLERIATPIFAKDQTRAITIYRSYSEGQSGGAVFGVREHSDIDGRHETRTSVMKVGDALALSLEREAYLSIVAPYKTGAFLEVRAPHSIVDGEAAIVYEDARRHVGGSLTGMETLHSLFRPTTSVEQASETLSRLLEEHLDPTFYRHGRSQDAGTVRYVMNEFLPAQWRVRVTHVDGGSVSDVPRAFGVDRMFRERVEVTEFNPEKALARAYTGAHDKLDLLLDDVKEELLPAFRVGVVLEVEGSIVDDREGFFRAAETSATRTLAGSGWSQPTSPLRTLGVLADTLGQELRNFRISTVHGDLHGGNVLVTPSGHLGIIDYGKTRRDYPSMYDVAFLMADLKIRMAVEQVDRKDLLAAERSLATGRGMWTRLRMGQPYKRLQLFEYDRLPGVIQSLGPRELFYGLFAVACLGRLKFDIQSHERLVAMELAHTALTRLDRHASV